MVEKKILHFDMKIIKYTYLQLNIRAHRNSEKI